jgi:hypothetical protein
VNPFARFLRFLQWLLRPEHLGTETAPREGPRPRDRVCTLLASEALPADPVTSAAGGRTGRLLGRLFAREELGRDEPSEPSTPAGALPRRRLGFLWILQREELGHEAAPTPGEACSRNGASLAWLFARDHLGCEDETTGDGTPTRSRR